MVKLLLTNLRPAVVAIAALTLLLGIAYPLGETGIGQLLFSSQANGSLTANGSAQIGQSWSGPQWFHGRPDSYDPMASGGTNLGPRSKTLVQDTQKQIAQLKKEGITPTTDLVTTSGSGLDPDISPADAYAQANSVAQARGLSPAAVRKLVAAHVQGPEFGFLGAKYVNVLQLNEALAQMR
jgi:potassium-transporting ATPase KdpC subunit